MAAAPTVGLGLKPAHYASARGAPPGGLWFEVHAENFLVDGGAPLARLAEVRERHPIALHGVAMSLAADAPPDPAHLARLAKLVRAIEPMLVSEHLAWSTWRGAWRPDLLPFPRTEAALARIADNVGRVQDALGRRIAVENPSHYLRIAEHGDGEVQFLDELARRSGCALLLDVNNVYVSARNLGYSAEAYLDAFPGEHVTEIHLAGHSEDPVHGSALLVDSHDAPVAQPVLDLYARLVARIGPRPTLIERDDHLPPYDELEAERNAVEVLTGPSPVPREARPDSRRASVGRGVGPGALARFQDAFADALLSDAPAQAAPRDVAALVAQPGFAIYRNTVIKGCVDALAANYPATLRIVGEAWFRAAAALYAREHLPGDPALARYGERFAAFLAGFAPAAELPYLPDVARLDRFWTEVSIARDEPAAGAADVAALPLDDPARILLVPHASARWAWFEAAPIFTLWERNRAAGPYDDSPLDWRGEGALVLRPGDGVRALPLDAAGCALMDACAAGDSVARAADAVLASHPDADFAALLARLLDAGAFGSVRLRSTSVDRAVSIV